MSGDVVCGRGDKGVLFAGTREGELVSYLVKVFARSLIWTPPPTTRAHASWTLRASTALDLARRSLSAASLAICKPALLLTEDTRHLPSFPPPHP